MSSTPEIPDSSFRDKVDIDFFGDSVLLTLPRPVLDINTKNFEVFSAPVPVISRDASKILFIEETFFIQTNLLPLASDRGTSPRR